jgi:hypothetical protein
MSLTTRHKTTNGAGRVLVVVALNGLAFPSPLGCSDLSGPSWATSKIKMSSQVRGIGPDLGWFLDLAG